MSDLALKFPRFFVTAPTACPYLPGRHERKVFTELHGPDAGPHLETLSHAGFRRSQNIAYRSSCDGCSACVSVRVRVEDFNPSETMRRLLKRNSDLQVYACRPQSTAEQYELLKTYLEDRHPDGGMATMDEFDYADMIEHTPVDTLVLEYREPPAAEGDTGRLLGVCVTDRFSDGYSMVYSFYDVHAPRRGLGTYIILDHIRRALTDGKPHVYLGYWVKGSPKMDYKKRFRPLEMLTVAGWSLLEND